MSEKYLTQIGESVHASIPKPGAAMKALVEKGPKAYDEPSEPLDFLISLIVDQAAGGADFIAINVDAFGEEDPQLAVDLMRQYVRLVKKHSNGVPACIDSSDLNVLKAGLDEWHTDAPADITSPLVNSVKTTTMDDLLPLRAQHAFKVVGMLVDEDGNTDEASADTIYNLAKTIFTGAKKHGFANDEIYFDTTTYPLAIDMPLTPDTPSFTYRAFQAIKRIKADPEMTGVHCSLGISNSVKDLPARKIGICRAYVEKARSYGLDTGIVNVMHQYGQKPADAELLDLVDAFALQDGSMDASTKAMMMMGEFCAANRK